MALEKYTIVTYNGTDIGKIYLEDVGKRPGLGGGEQFKLGQDIVVNHGDIITLVNSGEVLLSSDKGILKTWSTFNADALKEIVASGAALPTWAEVGGVTGLAAPLTLEASAGVTGYRPGLTGAKANPPITIGDF